MKKNKYMHTILGQPAQFIERNKQITYAGRGPVKLCTSLKQIRAEQARTLAQRKAWGFERNERWDKYGYVLVAV